MWRKTPLREILPLSALTLLGFLVMGYHPGLEDDGIYLSAVEAKLNPALFPFNSDFFRLQMQASVFDSWMAHFVRLTRIPLPWAELFWQFVALFLILWASRRIAAHLFLDIHSQWAAVAMVAAMFTLPVAGTALVIADQHLHPRNLVTALILVAIERLIENRRLQALPFLILALLLHPLMAAFGFSFCVCLALNTGSPFALPSRASQSSAAAAAPLGWLFAPATPSWREALASRTYYSVYRWTWYEWLGALAPTFLFWLLGQFLKRQAKSPRHRPAAEILSQDRLARFAQALLIYAVFQQVVAMVLLAPSSLERVAPLQPMRYLQLVYLFLALIAGGLLGQFVIRKNLLRWSLYLAIVNGGMFLAQWRFIDNGAHLELPGTTTANPWLQAFVWMSRNTPSDAYFALDPRYLAAPGEGFHSFRALAERSQLADAIKDTAVVVQVPSLAPLWHRQLAAQQGWDHFQLADFERLNAQFGVDWVLVNLPAPPGLDCQWHNQTLAVCRIPFLAPPARLH